MEDKSITNWVGENLAELLSDKIKSVYNQFDSENYIEYIKINCLNLSYTQRIELHAKTLNSYLPQNYKQAVDILTSILGEENPYETGMFTNYYWILPIAKFVEIYGLDEFEVSIKAIEEITKRCTGEYAIRPYIRKYPEKTIQHLQIWSKSDNFHLRRLASEGVRPKLPWATKLDCFIEKPDPVFVILNNLMTDDIKFVQKSVANNLTDYLKVNKHQASKFIMKHINSENKNTQWIIKHATRKIRIEEL